MASFIVPVLVVLAVAADWAFAAAGIDYDSQGEWPGTCATPTGNIRQQSPVDIITAHVQVDPGLIGLVLSGWEELHEGVLSNSGAGMRFDPLLSLGGGGGGGGRRGVLTTTNHIGTYNLVQFHMHWGKANGEGSEHQVDGEPAELEIHFVHSLQNPTGSERNTLTVVGVLGDVDKDASLTAPWTQLDPTAVKTQGSNVTIQDFLIDQLLPDDLSYWFYEGSLTTPPCTESVAWFVLKDRITVPGAFLEKLREVEDSSGVPITRNWREIQPMGARRVSMETTPHLNSNIEL